MAFDAVIEFGYDGKQIVHDIIHEVKTKAYPDMNVSVLLDRDLIFLSMKKTRLALKVKIHLKEAGADTQVKQ